MLKKLIVLVVGVVVVLGACITSILIVNKPTNVVAKSLQNLTDDLSKREEFELFEDFLTSGSVSASVSNIVYNDEDVLLGAKFSGKMYYSQSALMFKNLNIDLVDEKIIGDIYISEDEIYVKEDNYLKGKYGINLNTIKNDLANSIFAPTSSSDYALDEYSYNEIIKFIDQFNNFKTERKDFNQDAEELTKELTEELWAIACEEFKFESKNEQITVNCEDIKARVITITIDGESMADFVEEAYKYLKETDSIVNFLTKYETTLSALDSYSYDDKTIVERYQETLDEFGEDLEDELEEIEENLDTLTIKISTSKLRANILKFEFIAEEEGNLFTIEFGKKGLKKTDEICVTFGDISLKYTFNKSRKGTINAELEIIQKYKTNTQKYVFSLNADKNEGTYVLQASNYSIKNSTGFTMRTETYTVEGVFEKGKDVLKLSIDSIECTYDETYNHDVIEKITLDCLIVIRANDQMPEIESNYKSVDDITEEDLDNLLEFLPR